MSFAKKTIIVTGATSGIGRAVALRFARENACLAVCGRSSEKMAPLVSELKNAGAADVFSRTFDATNNALILQFVNDAAMCLGAPKILVNNAGANLGKAPVSLQNADALDAMFALNCRAPLVFTQACHPLMAAGGGGFVVNMISTTALFSNAGVAGYTASKAALDAWTKIYRKEAKAEKIRVISIYPGGTDTPFRPNARPDYMTPETVAEAVFYAVSAPENGTVHEIVLRPEVEENF